MSERQRDDWHLHAFEEQRSRLFGLAYRLLGSAADADDVLQDAFLRFCSAPAAAVRSPGAYLSTVVSRLCFDLMHSAQRRREHYPGDWLPEPLSTPPDVESISYAFMVILEQLSPAERAVFLLHEVFDYSHREIGVMLDKTPQACRQLGSRARRHIAARRGRFRADTAQHRRILRRFTEATERGDLEGLIALLANDATLVADGGGQVRGAAMRPVHGARAVGRFLISSRRLAPDGCSLAIEQINNGPALVMRKPQGNAFLVVTLVIEGRRISAVHALANPAKLTRL